MQILSASPQLPYGEDRGKAVAAARFVNDQYAALVESYPDHFRAFAATPMPHIDASVAELGRALDELHMAGVTMNTTVLNHALVEPSYEPIFAELDRRAAVLYLHPAGNSACTPLIADYHLTWMVGAPVEDTISTMQLITHGIPSRYPHIKIINSHLGGALPMLIQRADDQYKWEAPGTPERPSIAARRMWYDSVGHGHVPALRCAIDSFGADRLLLGTDFPYEAGDIFVRAVNYITDPRITEARGHRHPGGQRHGTVRHHHPGKQPVSIAVYCRNDRHSIHWAPHCGRYRSATRIAAVTEELGHLVEDGYGGLRFEIG